jgi:glycosyltransferase involved in cell wall biosynthesis
LTRKRKIRVNHVRTSQGVYGAERVILGLLRSADRSKFDVSVTLVASEEGLNSDFAEAVRNLGVKVNGFLFRGRLDLAGARRLRKHVGNCGYDILHCHDFKANFYGILATLGTRVKRVTTHHGSTKDDALLRLYLRFNEVLLVRLFHRVIAVSKTLSGEGWAKALGTRLTFIPNGIDTDFINERAGEQLREAPLPLPRGKKVIGIVGRLFPDKGHEDLFRAMMILRGEFPDLIVLVVGDGPHGEYLRRRCKEMGLEDRVNFAGVRHNMGEVYRAADLFVMPSLREGLPMALLEAMLAEVPVVATRVGGMKSVVEDGKRGRGVDPCDPQGLAGAIKGVLVDAEGAKGMASEASAFVRANYSAETMARRTERVYREVIHKNRRLA